MENNLINDNLEISKSLDGVSRNYLYNEQIPNKKSRPYTDTDIVVEMVDSVNAVHKYAPHVGRTAVLNFASYKNAGGGYLRGSRAQEECLCRCSNLHFELSKMEDRYYNVNKTKLNLGLYTDTGLYTEDVVFFRDGKENLLEKDKYTKCDVITIAAPNRNATRYRLTMEEHNKVLLERCKYVLKVAQDKEVTTLILGAYGCGVFRNEPYTVATCFRQLLEGEFKGCFERVVFPMISYKMATVFKEVLLNNN